MTGRTLAGVAAAVAALVVPAGARAHPVLVGSSPADGARLSAPPHVLRLHFSEAISAQFRIFQLLRADGRTVQGVRLRRVSPEHVELVMPPLRRGSYGLVWHVLSEDDGHTTDGTLTFGVGVGALSRPHAVSTAPSADDVALRWLRFAAIAVLAGGVGFVALVLPFARPWIEPLLVRRAGRRVLTAGAVAGGAAIAVHAAILARQTGALAEAGGRSWAGTLGALLGSRWGALWLTSLGLLVLLTGLVLVLRKRAPAVSPAALALGVAAAAALAGAQAAGSHAAALPHPPLAVAADGAHVLAAAFWFGGVVALVIALAPVRGLRPVEAHALAIVLRRSFAALAGSSLLIAVVTGLYGAGIQVASVDALLTSLYGLVVLAKALVVVACCAAGGFSFFALRLLDRRRLAHALRVSIAVEAAAGAGALVAAAVLTASAPARGPEYGPPRAVRAPTLAAQTADIVVSVTVRPNRPGVNLVSVFAASSRRPAPAPIAAVAARGAGSRATTELRRVGGRWVGTVRLGAPGDTALALLVRRAGDTLAARVRWRVDAPDPAQPVRFSSRRLDSIIDPGLVVLLAAVGAAGAAAILRRRQPPAARRLPQEKRA